MFLDLNDIPETVYHNEKRQITGSKYVSGCVHLQSGRFAIISNSEANWQLANKITPKHMFMCVLPMSSLGACALAETAYRQSITAASWQTQYKTLSDRRPKGMPTGKHHLHSTVLFGRVVCP